MPDISEDSTYHNGVRQIETSDAILGGAPEDNLGDINSPINYSLKQLVDRTKWLNDNATTPQVIGNASESAHGIIRRATEDEALDNNPSDTLALSPSHGKSMIDVYAPAINYATELLSGTARFPDMNTALAGVNQTLVPTVLRGKQMAENLGGASYGVWNPTVGGPNWGLSGDSTYNSQDPIYIKVGNLVMALAFVEFPSQADKTTHFYNFTPGIAQSSDVSGFTYTPSTLPVYGEIQSNGGLVRYTQGDILLGNTTYNGGVAIPNRFYLVRGGGTQARAWDHLGSRQSGDDINIGDSQWRGGFTLGNRVHFISIDLTSTNAYDFSGTRQSSDDLTIGSGNWTGGFATSNRYYVTEFSGSAPNIVSYARAWDHSGTRQSGDDISFTTGSLIFWGGFATQGKIFLVQNGTGDVLAFNLDQSRDADSDLSSNRYRGGMFVGGATPSLSDTAYFVSGSPSTSALEAYKLVPTVPEGLSLSTVDVSTFSGNRSIRVVPDTNLGTNSPAAVIGLVYEAV